MMLQTISLVDIDLTRESINELISLLSVIFNHSQPYLRHLDISSNRILFPNYIQLLECLSKCYQMHLEYLSLDNNELFDEAKSRKLMEEQPKVNYQQLIIQYFTDLIMDSHHLTHLNLSNTGLNEEIVHALLPAIKSSTSLVAVHLSSNPGITERSKAEIMEFFNLHE